MLNLVVGDMAWIQGHFEGCHCRVFGFEGLLKHWNQTLGLHIIVPSRIVEDRSVIGSKT